jgi:hypothetical protein
MRRYLYAFIAFSAALAVRLYPTLLSGLPFSTDAWSPIRNTELLLEHTPISLDDDMMDGYNCYWPANSLFCAVLSQAAGLKPMVAMAFGIPLAGALTIPILYTLLCRISRRPAFLSSILLAITYPYAFFTAGVTKETYANPLYILLILIFMSRGGWGRILLFAVASSALVMSHHLTSLIAIAILANIALASYILSVMRGVSQDRSGFLLVSILTAAAALYFGLYAYRGLRIAFTLSDLLSAASYQILAFAITLYLAFKPQPSSDRGMLPACIASAAIAFLAASLCTRRSIMPDAPILPSRYILYAAPFILTSPLTVLGVGELHGMQSWEGYALLFWLSTLLGLESYAVFGSSPLGLTLAYRTLNILCIPLTILSGFGLHRLCKASDGLGRRGAVKPAVMIVLIAIVALNSYSIYASILLQERYMGYFWLYRRSEYHAAAWVRGVACNQTIAGDVKASYILRGYFGLSVDVLYGLKYLAGEAASEPRILFTYDQMAGNGYVIYGGYSVDLPGDWRGRILRLNLVYSSRVVDIHEAG